LRVGRVYTIGREGGGIAHRGRSLMSTIALLAMLFGPTLCNAVLLLFRSDVIIATVHSRIKSEQSLGRWVSGSNGSLFWWVTWVVNRCMMIH